MPKFQLKLFSGTSHRKLAEDIAKGLGVKLSQMEIYKFACGETYARALETVRGCNVFVVQTATHNVNEDLMELFVIIDALKRSFAKRIHVVMPHYAYARQDRVALPREPISAKLIADLLSAAGADHVIAVNLHSDQEQGFFDFPVDNLNCLKLFTDYFKKKKLKDITVVSPDAGGAKDAKKLADKLGATLAVIHKARPAPNKSHVTHVVGEVKGRTCVLYDDMIDTGGSICAAMEALLAHGAKKDIYVAATHAVFSDPAVSRLKKAKFKEVIVTDSIPLPKEKRFNGLKVLSIAPLLAKTIKSVHEEKSVTANL